MQCYAVGVKLSQWARSQHIHPRTAMRWFRAGTLPVPARQLPSGTILVEEALPSSLEHLALYASVFSHDQRADLNRQLGRLVSWAVAHQLPVTHTVAEIRSGMNCARPKLRRLLADGTVTTIVVEPDEVEDDLVRDMTEVLTSLCARLYGRRSARTRAARYAYNWALERVQESLRARKAFTVLALRQGARLDEARAWAAELVGPVPSAITTHRRWNVWKKLPGGITWWGEVSKCAPQEAFRDLDLGLAAFWQSRAGRRAGTRVGFPRFKKKGRSRDSFRLTGAIHLQGRAVTLPRLGSLRLSEDPTRWVHRLTAGNVRITCATVSREADRWFVALGVEVERDIPATNGAADTIGVDLGVLALATLSDGTVVPGPKALRRGLRKLRRLSRAHSRKRRGSHNRQKAARRLARHHAKVAAIRRDHLHQLTTALAKTHGRIVVEELNVQGMLWNRRLVVADRWFPSSKRCSGCGTVEQDLALSERTYRCRSCGLAIDRDLNAAINLAGWAHPTFASSAGETQNACGANRRSSAWLADGCETGTGTAPERPGSARTPHPLGTFVTP